MRLFLVLTAGKSTTNPLSARLIVQNLTTNDPSTQLIILTSHEQRLVGFPLIAEIPTSNDSSARLNGSNFHDYDSLARLIVKMSHDYLDEPES